MSTLSVLRDVSVHSTHLRYTMPLQIIHFKFINTTERHHDKNHRNYRKSA